MIVAQFQKDEFERCWSEATDEQKSGMSKEIDDVIMWCSLLDHVEIPDLEEHEIPFVEQTETGPHEVFRPMKGREYEAKNRKLLRDIDKRIQEMYRNVKAIGFSGRMSHLCYKSFESSLYGEKIGRFDANELLWHRVMLFLCRLKSTSRIVARFEYPDRFGPKTSFEDGEVVFEYGSDPWRVEMRRRGILVPKKSNE